MARLGPDGHLSWLIREDAHSAFRIFSVEVFQSSVSGRTLAERRAVDDRIA